MLLLLTLACTNSRSPVDTGPTGGDSAGDSAGTGGDTAGETGESGDTGGETAEPLPSPWSWITLTLAIGGRGSGFDLDDDGSPDNAAHEVENLLGPLFAAEMATASHLPVLQVSGLDAWTDDDATLAMFPGDDVDGDPTDNATGGEPVSGGAAVDGEGVALDRVSIHTVNGVYGVELRTWTLEVGCLRFVSPVPVHAAGTITADGHRTQIGLGLPLATVEALVSSADSTSLDALERAADLDADGDGTFDTLSAAFDLSAAECVVLP